jgi:hypothetical protein
MDLRRRIHRSPPGEMGWNEVIGAR